MDQYSFYCRALQHTDIREMYFAFLDAFSDYPINFNLSYQQFVLKFIDKLDIDFELSVGAIELDGLAGFLFTTLGEYHGRKTAYNGGTGVRPQFRGNRLSKRMYEFLFPLLKENNVEQCVLEVLVQNNRALKAYEALGFEKTRRYKCYELKMENVKKSIAPGMEITGKTVSQLSSYSFQPILSPSFLDTTAMLQRCKSAFCLLEMAQKGSAVGYIIFEPNVGRINQLAVHPEYRRKGIATALISHIFKTTSLKSLTMVNVPEEARELIAFMNGMGINSKLDQYELTLTM